MMARSQRRGRGCSPRLASALSQLQMGLSVLLAVAAAVRARRAPHLALRVCGSFDCEEANQFVLTVSLNNTALLKQAAEQLNVSELRKSMPWVEPAHVVCTELRKGTLHNLNHSWHCARDKWTFFQQGSIKCDGTPAAVDANLDRFLQRGLFCPWSSQLLRCEDAHCKKGLPPVAFSRAQYIVEMPGADAEEVDAAEKAVLALPEGAVSRKLYGPMPLLECQFRDADQPAVLKLPGVHTVIYDLPA